MREPLLLGRVPGNPYCTQPSGVFAEGVYRRPRETALERPHLQVNGDAHGFLLFDIDREDSASAWKRIGLEPWWQAENPANGHVHACWALRDPVLLSARSKPAEYLRSVSATMRTVLKADKGFSGLLTKNPTHPRWKVETGGCLVSLGELAERLPRLENPKPRRRIHDGRGADEGRNSETYWAVCKVSHSAIRGFWGDKAGFDGFLCDFGLKFTRERHNPPLDASEVRTIAKSAGKWTWHRFSQHGFSESQARRGRKGGIKSGQSRRTASLEREAEVVRLRAEGRTASQIESLTGIPRRTAYRLLARARGKGSSRE